MVVWLLILTVVFGGFTPAVDLGQRATANESRNSTGSVVEVPFAVGEQLNYEVSWSNFIVAGELTLETRDRRKVDGNDAFHLVAQAQSVGLVSAVIYKVNDVYESFINAGTLMPFRAEKRSRRGKRQEQVSVTLDHQQGRAKFSDGKSIEIPPDTYDMAGLIYAIRTIDLKPGKSRTFTLLEDEKLYRIRVEPEGRETVTTRSGNYDAIRITTRMVDDERRSNLHNLRIYLSNDSRRLPVLITAEPAWGSVRVELTSVSGTRKK